MCYNIRNKMTINTLYVAMFASCFAVSAVQNVAVKTDEIIHRSSDHRPSAVLFPWQHGIDVMKPLFTSAVELLQQRPEQILDAVGNFVDNVERTSGHRVPEEILSAVERLREMVHNWGSVKADDPGCDLCKIVITGMKALLTKFTFEELQEEVVLICYVLAGPDMAEDKKQDLCNGSVAIQGPHVAYIIEASTPQKICDFQNACFLSTTTPKRKSLFRKTTVSAIEQNSMEIEAEKLNEPITVAQLTDIHIDIRYQQGTLTDCQLPICCSDKYGPGPSGPFGDYSCNIPPRTVEEFVRKVAALDPDFMLYSGDISGSRVWDETLEEILNCTLALTNALNSNIGQRVVYPSFGNHEMYPTNLYYKDLPDVVTLTNALTDWWTPIANFSEEQRRTMNEAGYYSAVVRPGLRLVNYNSNYMYTANFYNVLNHGRRIEVTRMIAFVEQEFRNARINNEKIIVMGHHPTNSGDYLIEFGHWYRELILNYSDIVVLQIAGHRHCDFFNLITDDNGEAASMVYLAPPVTAGGRKNPSVRIYSLDPNTFEVLDYDQYYLDLSSVAPNASNIEPQIVQLYSAKHEYNLTDLSPKSWASFVDRMEEDNDLLLHHVRHYYINARGSITCDDTCRRAHICGLRNSVYDRHYFCINPLESATSSGTSTMATSSSSVDTVDSDNTTTTSDSGSVDSVNSTHITLTSASVGMPTTTPDPGLICSANIDQPSITALILQFVYIISWYCC